MNESLHLVCPHCAAVNRLPSAKLGNAPRCGQCKATLFTGQPLTLSATNFDRHIGRSDLPVVVDFWAPWCGPCKMMTPIFAEACTQMEPLLRFAKVNTEIEPQLAARFGIRSIPTLALFKNGQETTRHSGALDLASLKRWLSGHLQKI
jgi:thioredoxin 2